MAEEKTSTSTSTKYRYVGNHAIEIMLGDRTVPTEPGGFVDLTSDDEDHPYNKALMDLETLIKVEGGNQ